MSNKKNLGSVVIGTVLTLGLVFGLAWAASKGWSKGKD
jgi:hypothetical protein